MNTPRVSILIPCYNASETVARAVDSALSQTFTDLEVIIADDGSTDDSLEVLARYADDARVRVSAESHRGGNATRNRLIQMARGEFVQFLDADDELEPRKVEACLSLFGTGVDMVFTDCWVVDAGYRRREMLEPPRGDLVEYFIRHSVITMLPLCRTRTLRDAGGFDAALPCCQEYELHLRLARHSWSRVEKVPDALCVYHRMAGSVSSNQSRIFLTKAGILLRLAEALERAGDLNQARRNAIASEVLMCVRELSVTGCPVEARELYDRARLLAPTVPYPAKWPLRVAVAVMGPVRAENLRAVVVQLIRKRSNGAMR